ncbi:MAG: GAF domain-containing protein, partial [Pedobacter sp.]
MKREFYRYLLEKIETEEALAKTLDVASLAQHKDTLELIFTILTPLLSDESELYWALSTPVPQQIFFSTDPMHDFIKSTETSAEKSDGTHSIAPDDHQFRFLYNMIMARLYNYNTLSDTEMTFAHTSKENGLRQYYKVNVDTQFVDITYTKKTLPELNFDQFAGIGQNEKELEMLKQLLPLSDFRFDGFTVLSITDVSLQHALDGITNALVNHTYQQSAYEQIIESLKTLTGRADIDFGLLPFLTVNDKPVFDTKESTSSLLLNAGKQFGMDDELFHQKFYEYRKDPKPLFFNGMTDAQMEEMPLMDAIRKYGIKSYSILPVSYSGQTVGLLEVYAREELVLDDHLLSKLSRAIPLLGQLFQYHIEEFNTKMDEIIKDKFTALQPSVQWKFNEHAWDFLHQNKHQQLAQEIATVTFKELYPLFGAIDIRNSTTERNQALREDLKIQLDLLGQTILKLKEILRLELLDKLLFNAKDLTEKINTLDSSLQENVVSDFLEFEVHPVLKHIGETQPKTTETIAPYFESILPETGTSFQHRRTLESAMQMINTTVGEYLENAQRELQETYPFYFAKFRSDGVEYDIYIGQSIMPNTPFDTLYLKNIRLWQLQSMAEVARLTNGMLSQLSRPLFTTQLIFIHSNQIDISFRNDERRFDVEGAYNIRYEVIKKRIDKAKLKDGNERLTQPGKIAMVYYNSSEASEYITYIRYLQEQKILLNDLEELELEELQGVNGLKALRIGVN